MLKAVNINSSKRIEFIDITDQVAKVVSKSQINSGLACLFVPHTTTGITINEGADPSVIEDMINRTSTLVPVDGNYSHREGNADSHIKTSLFGPQVNVIIEDNKLVLGTWQAIYFAEFDGPRSRKLYIKIIES